MMEQHVDIMRRSLELCETILEGLVHIQKNLNEGNSEQTLYLFEDVLTAYTTICTSIEPVIDSIKETRLEDAHKSLNTLTELVVSAYEQRNYGKVQEILQFSLIPQFKRWKEQLEQSFHPHIIS